MKKGTHPSVKSKGGRVHTQALDKRLAAVIHLIFSLSIPFTLKAAVVTQVPVHLVLSKFPFQRINLPLPCCSSSH